MVFATWRHDTRGRESALLLVLTFGTGIVDAVSYLVLARVIAGNMSGNVLLLGMAVAGADGLQAAGPALAFAGFWLGAQACGRALGHVPEGWTWRTSALIASSGVVVALVGVGLIVAPPATSQPSGLGAATVLGACMGSQAAAARATGVADLTTDAVTGALVGLGLTFRDRRTDPVRWGRRMGGFALIGAGALVGALLIQAHPALALALVAALSLAVAAAGRAWIHPARPPWEEAAMTGRWGGTSRPQHDRIRVDVVLLLVLTFATGIVDAVGYLALDRVFLGNMTGNTVLLGSAIAGADHLQVLGPAVALGAFWAGTLACGRALRRRPRAWTSRISTLIAGIGLVVGAVAVLSAVMAPESSRAVGVMVAAVLGACMGLQAAAAYHLGVADVPTSAIDEQVTSLAADVGTRRRQPWGRRASSILLLGAGAFTGAMLLRWHVSTALGVAAGLALAVALAGQLALARVRAPR